MLFGVTRCCWDSADSAVASVTDVTSSSICETSDVQKASPSMAALVSWSVLRVLIGCHCAELSDPAT